MKKKRLPVIGIVLLILVLVIAGGIWYWNTHKKRIIRSEMDKAIKEKSDGLYKVHYDSLELDEINGSLSISSFTLVYDSLKYEQLKREQKEPYLLFNISIPAMRISGVQTPRALVDKEIRGRHVTIMNPVIEILYTGKDSSRTLPDKEIYEQILGNLNLIKLDSVVISGAEIITKSFKTGKTLVRFKNVSLSLLHVAVDSTAGADTTRIMFAKEMSLDCEKFTWQSQNKRYNYQVDSIAMRSATSTISIKSLFMIPTSGEDEFVRNAPHQTDRMDIAFHNIQFRSTDFYQLANEAIMTDTLWVGSATFKIYRDRNMPEDNTSKLGTYPHQLIQKIPVRFEIKKAIVGNANIEYKERSSITHQAGIVRFWGSSAYITNITNRKESIANNNTMTVDMKSSFLNKILLSAKWRFYLGNKDGKFSVSGKSGQADARLFNPLSVPMGPAEFKSGHIKKLEFNLAGTNRRIQGTMQLLYDDFKISLLKKDEDSVHFEKRKVASLFANMKIENSNPDDDEAPRVANLNMQRDMNRSIFSLIWKSLFEGIKEITGAKK